jgi:ADP-ribose pyrophosphatase YjhB (NUDIX family)
MGFEPQKFFIGLIDFFSIFLPGAVLAYVIEDRACTTLFGTPCPAITGTEGALVFLFGSYLLGHLIYLLSATLDELVYDPLRELTDWGQIKRLTKGEELSPRWQRRFATSHLLFGSGADNAVIQAQRIKARALHKLEGENAINAFQWCKARLTKELLDGSLAVQRLEADSKFFRSFVVVLGLLAILYSHRHQWPAAALSLLVMPPAFWRYVDQRFKATQQAYWFILALAGKSAPDPSPRPDRLTHAGGVVYTGLKKCPKFMLIGGSRNRDEKLLPKGHIEAGEDPRVTAVREVKEETGNWVKVMDWLGDRPLDKQKSNPPLVRWFLLELCEEPADPRPEDRPRKWLSPDIAIDQATYEETKQLLRDAAAKLDIDLLRSST